MAEGKGILSGIRVIDAATYIAAPAAAAVLADFGAEVIKVERPPHGDPHRYLSLVPGNPVSDQPYCWILDGRNKRSIALNLAVPQGRDVLLKLVATADVFITNYQPQLLDKFRLTYEELRPLNERLIYAQVSGYGETGEEMHKPGYDMTGYWARSGLMDYIHNADADPAQSPAGFGDHPTSMAVFGAIMLALYHRQRTGQGIKVSTSLMANGAWSNSCLLQAALCGAEWTVKRTRRQPHNPLVNHYLSADGKRFILCLLDPLKDWKALCDAVGRPELIGDPRFDTPYQRRANGGALVEILDAEFASHDMEYWTNQFRRHEVIWGPVPSTQQVARDPQMAATGVFPELAGGDGLRTVANPVNVHGIEKEAPRMAPAVGQHTVEILESLGFTGDQIRQLRDRGVAMQGPESSQLQ
ncbi:MAG: CoA transferase [Acidobacteria bacterium]|nr:CoA transferase [Acidobacteriota bacterium]